MTTIYFRVEVTIDDDDDERTATWEEADQVHDWMAGDGILPCPAWLLSVDGVEPLAR
jgi:hypothetical protein